MGDIRKGSVAGVGTWQTCRLTFLPLQVKGGVMASFREQLETQEVIAKKQKELERAKEQLYKIRRSRVAATNVGAGKPQPKVPPPPPPPASAGQL